jgi:hypothetical protein
MRQARIPPGQGSWTPPFFFLVGVNLGPKASRRKNWAEFPTARNLKGLQAEAAGPLGAIVNFSDTP